MDKNKVGTVIEPVEEGGTYTKNMFTAPLGDKYARGFHEVYHADLASREAKMKALYDEAMADESLSPVQKKIVKACYLGFNEAIGKSPISTPIIAYIDTRKPVLSKAIRTAKKKKNKVVKSNRLKRTVEDLYFVMERTGFFFEVAYLPSLLKVFEMQFTDMAKKGDKYSDPDNLTFESLVMAAFSSFGRACGPNSYANLWYIAYFMQNISLLAYINPTTYQSMPELKDQIAHIVKTINLIQILEMKRAGIIQEKPKVEEPEITAPKEAEPAEAAISEEDEKKLAELKTKELRTQLCNKFYDYLVQSLKGTDENGNEVINQDELNKVEEERKAALQSIEDGNPDPNAPWMPKPMPIHQQFAMQWPDDSKPEKVTEVEV